MKKSRFTEAQIALVLKQAEDGTAVGEVCRKAGISEATSYNWRKRYAGLMPSEMKRLCQLEEENGKVRPRSSRGGSHGHHAEGQPPKLSYAREGRPITTSRSSTSAPDHRGPPLAQWRG